MRGTAVPCTTIERPGPQAGGKRVRSAHLPEGQNDPQVGSETSRWHVVPCTTIERPVTEGDGGIVRPPTNGNRSLTSPHPTPAERGPQRRRGAVTRPTEGRARIRPMPRTGPHASGAGRAGPLPKSAATATNPSGANASSCDSRPMRTCYMRKVNLSPRIHCRLRCRGAPC